MTTLDQIANFVFLTNFGLAMVTMVSLPFGRWFPSAQKVTEWLGILFFGFSLLTIVFAASAVIFR